MKNLISTLDLHQRSWRRSYLLSVFFWNPLFSFVISIYFNGLKELWHHFLAGMIICTVVSQVCFGASRLLYFFEGWLAARKNLQRPVRKNTWYYLASLSAMPLGVFLAFKITTVIAPYIGLPVEPVEPEDYRITFLIGTLIGGLFFFFKTNADSKEAARTAELKFKQLENDRLQAQLSALTAQMNPHLLFNALNTVASLVQTDPVKAEETIIKLSELYRGVLDSSRKMNHSLATEIEICEAYLGVEKARFGERLKSNIEIDPQVNIQTTEIPALSLQPLVENAVKHGLASRASGGEIFIRISQIGGKLQINVEDNGIGFSQSATIKKQGAGSGIKNCQDRLQLHYSDSGKFNISERIGGGTIITLVIPLQSVKGIL